MNFRNIALGIALFGVGVCMAPQPTLAQASSSGLDTPLTVPALPLAAEGQTILTLSANDPNATPPSTAGATFKVPVSITTSSLVVLGSSCPTNGMIATNSTGALLNCVSGIWSTTGKPCFANYGQIDPLIAPNGTTGYWIPVPGEGMLYLPNVTAAYTQNTYIETGTIAINNPVNLGTCSYPKLQIQCQNGTWAGVPTDLASPTSLYICGTPSGGGNGGGDGASSGGGSSGS